MVEEGAAIKKILESGIKEVFIDTGLGADVAAEKVADETEEPACEPSRSLPNIISKISPAEEFSNARNLYSSANKLMQGMLRDIRLGKQIELERCEPMIDNIVDSIFRMPSALLPLAQMKSVDEYTFQHSVSVAALSVAFGRVLDLPRDEIKALSLGGLLHDIGKAKVPGSILNKPGKLDDAEFGIMKNHVVHTAELLKDVKGISEITFNAAAQHHERYDGSGYPEKLKGDRISLHGQVIAIVDVYDALTSIRVYHKGVPPNEALKRLFEWSGAHFNPRLVQAFIKGVGIYPAGSLVRMDSDKLGIVREVVPDKLLQPVVQIIYDCDSKRYITPEMMDLSASNDKIKSHESFEAWGIDQAWWATRAY